MLFADEMFKSNEIERNKFNTEHPIQGPSTMRASGCSMAALQITFLFASKESALANTKQNSEGLRPSFKQSTYDQHVEPLKMSDADVLLMTVGGRL